MDREQFLLVKLAEECNEVAQMAIKSMQFGLDNVKPDQPYTNRERLNQEFNDLITIMQLLSQENYLEHEPPSPEWIEEKLGRIEKFYNISKEMGKIK